MPERFPGSAGSPVHGPDSTADTLGVFTEFAVLAATETDVLALSRAACAVVSAHFGGSGAYYERRDGLWQPLTRAPERAGEQQALLCAPLPLDAPPLVQALGTQQPVFLDEEEKDPARGPGEARGGVCVYPLTADDEVRGLFTVGLPAGRRWQDRDRALVGALGRSLALALERGEQARRLEQERATAEHRNRTLEAFAQLSRDLAVETDRLTLVRRAQEIVFALLPSGYAAYYEPEGGLWRLRSQVGDLNPAETQLLAAHRLPLDFPVLWTPWHTRQPYYRDEAAAPADRAEVPPHASTSATLPLLVHGAPVGVFAISLFDGRGWSALDKAVLETALRHLSLALERAEQVARLEVDARAQEAFVDFTEAVGNETDVPTLQRRALAVLHARFPGSAAACYEHEDGLWKGRVWTAGVKGELARLMAAGLPRTPLLDEVLRTRACVFTETRHERRYAPEYGAIALAPLWRGDALCGVLALGLHDARPWTAHEQAVVRAVARGLNLALERSEQARQLREERTALEAFAAFTEHAGTETDLLALVEQAARLVRDNLAHVSVAYYELEAERWRAQVWSEDLSPELVAQLVAGVPQAAPSFAEAMRSKSAFFADGWNAQADSLPSAAQFGAAAFVPILVEGSVPRMFTVGTRDARGWTAREQAIIRAVGRALGLAIARAQVAGQLQAQNAELDARTRALEGFSALTRDLSVHADIYELIRRAQEVVLSLLPSGYALYYEREGERWRNRVQVGDVGNADLQAFIDAGPLVGMTPSVDRPWTTQQALYQDDYARGSDTPKELVEHVNAAASLPVLRNGTPVGVFIAVLFEQRPWSRTDRAVLETVVGSLGLALERAEQGQRLEAQRAEVDARNKVLSTFEEWTRDLSLVTHAGSSDPSALIRRAQALLFELLPIQVAVYYERAGDRWWVHSMLGEFGSEGLRRAHEAGLPHQTTGNLRVPSETGAVFYQDTYDGDTDGLAEHMEHVSATAMLPLRAAGRVRGIFGLALFGGHGWTAADRTVIETVGGSLELALDRAEKTAELEAERATLAGQTAALGAANEELEAFAYSVSHDLRTPVRHIMGFNELLRKSFGTQLDAKAARYLTVIDEAAQSMNSLIDAMLDLSRTSRLPLRLGPVDLGALVRQIQRESEPELLGREVRWDIAELPLVNGDHDMLRQVLVNLVSNALKYSRTRDLAVIGIWAEQRERETAVFVRDNGVGFDARYQDKLFGVFQRLHRADEFEGTGVGLANVRRILQRHGGEVFAQSLPGQGATFGFTLPTDT